MAMINPFDLLVDDAEDPSLIAALKPVVSPPAAAATKKGPAQTQPKPAPAAKLPFKPLPPSQAGQLLLFLFILLFVCGFSVFFCENL
jgi:plasminogen activator inhibitor 1 RNA-binding protein